MSTEDIDSFDGVPDDLRLIIIKTFGPKFSGELNVEKVFSTSLDVKSYYKMTPSGTYQGDAIVGCVIDSISIMKFKIPFNESGNLHGDVECAVTEYILGTTQPIAIVHYDNTPINKVNGTSSSSLSSFLSNFTRFM
jgi:hypothetical protein